MTAWVVRGVRRGEREPEALDNGFLCIGFGLRGDMSGVSGRDGFTETLRGIAPRWPMLTSWPLPGPQLVPQHQAGLRRRLERLYQLKP